MASTGTRRPVHRSHGQGGLVHQHPEPADATAPSGRRRDEQRRLGRVVDEVDDHLPGVQRTGVDGERVRCRTVARSMPSGVAWTTRSAAGHVRARPDTSHRPGQGGAVSARATVRFTTTTSTAPASARARMTARAAPPAPTTTHRFAGRVEPRGASPARPGTLPVGGVTHAAPRRAR